MAAVRSAKSKSPRVVTGEYSAGGYTVMLHRGGRIIGVYSAGNHPHDSQAQATVGVGLRRMRSFCIRTCREIAGEKGAGYGGVEHVEDGE